MANVIETTVDRPCVPATPRAEWWEVHYWNGTEWEWVDSFLTEAKAQKHAAIANRGVVIHIVIPENILQRKEA